MISVISDQFTQSWQRIQRMQTLEGLRHWQLLPSLGNKHPYLCLKTLKQDRGPFLLWTSLKRKINWQTGREFTMKSNGFKIVSILQPCYVPFLFDSHSKDRKISKENSHESISLSRSGWDAAIFSFPPAIFPSLPLPLPFFLFRFPPVVKTWMWWCIESGRKLKAAILWTWLRTSQTFSSHLTNFCWTLSSSWIGVLC